MDVGAMEVPVAQAGPPNAEPAPCTPPKSSQKIQNNEAAGSNEEPVEFDDEDVVSPSLKPRHWKLLGEWYTTAPPPDAQSQTVTVLKKQTTANVCGCCSILMRRRLVRVRKSVVDVVLCSESI